MAHFINCSSCGKQYNKDAFDKCPFCGASLSAKHSVDDILNDFSVGEKEEQESYRKKILNYFQIDGDVTDEQFEELRKKYHQRFDKNKELFTPNAEAILNKLGKVIKAFGIALLILCIIIAVVFIVIAFIDEEGLYLIEALSCVTLGVIAYIVCIVNKAFIDVFVNISVTLQDVNSKTKNIS